MNPLQPLLAVVPEYPEGTDLWTTREPCRSPGFLKRDSSTSLQQKKKKKVTSLDALDKVSGILTAPPLPQGGTARLNLPTLTSPGGEEREVGEGVRGCPASPAVCHAAGETHFTPAAPRVLRRDLHGSGEGEIWKEADNNI